MVSMHDEGHPLSVIAKACSTSAAWVSRRLTEIGVHNPAKASDKFITAEEDLIIADLTLTARQAAELLPNRTEGSVKNRRTVLGLSRIKKRKAWSDEEVKYILDNPHKTDYELGKHFGMHDTAVKSVRLRNGGLKNHSCIECGEDLGSKGKYCKDHRFISKQIACYRNGVKKKGGDITDEDIAALVKSDCTYCGQTGGGIDRVDSSIGYFKSNVAPSCTTCNVMKMAMDHSDWIAQMRIILEKHDG